jgi:hypothetical protein
VRSLLAASSWDGPLVVSESVDFGVVRMEASSDGSGSSSDGGGSVQGHDEAAANGGGGGGSGSRRSSDCGSSSGSDGEGVGGGSSGRRRGWRPGLARYRSVRVTNDGNKPLFILDVTAVGGWVWQGASVQDSL